MNEVRFLRVELSFGRHTAAFELDPAPARPYLMVGGNGSGKTTLLEGTVRTLFGFNRQREQDRAAHSCREPWDGSIFEGRVELLARDGRRYEVRRNMTTERVELLALDGARERQSFDGNPASTNAEARAYRRWLRERVGLSDLDAWIKTTFVAQGVLAERGLDRELLAIASGGTVDFDAAVRDIDDRFRELTAAAIPGRGRAAQKPREAERLRQRIERTEAELRDAESTAARRGPLLEEHRAIDVELVSTRERIDLLERAHKPLVELRAAGAERRSAEARIETLEKAAAALRDRDADLRSAVTRRVATEAPGRYPDDFPERTALLERSWREGSTLAAERRAIGSSLEGSRVPSIVWTVSAMLVAAGGLAYALFVSPPWPGLAAMLAGLGGALMTSSHRSKLRRNHEVGVAALDRLRIRQSELDRELDRISAGFPDPSAVRPDALDLHRAGFARQRDADAAVEEARAARSYAAHALAESIGVAGFDVKTLLGQALERITAARNEFVILTAAVERAELALYTLADDVPRDPDELEIALRDQRAHADDLSKRLESADRRLFQEARPSASPVALQDALDSARRELDEVETSIDALGAARALLVDSHAEFRRSDQQRLVELISEHLRALTSNRLGPLRTDDDLGKTTIDAFDRALPLAHGPLSYGQHLAVQLAIRLGATDFLARGGVRLPLILDEPFAHLDADLTAALWRRLVGIAESRQVIVATQDDALLEPLGVEPDLRLASQNESRTPRYRSSSRSTSGPRSNSTSTSR